MSDPSPVQYVTCDSCVSPHVCVCRPLSHIMLCSCMYISDHCLDMGDTKAEWNISPYGLWNQAYKFHISDLIGDKWKLGCDK